MSNSLELVQVGVRPREGMPDTPVVWGGEGYHR